MSADENKAIVNALGDAINRKDLSFMDAHPGLQESKPFFQSLITAFPDMQGSMQTTVATDEWVANRVNVSGTMKGMFQGMAPTGKHATWEVIQMFRIVDGKIVESYGQADVMGMMQQLGLMPAPGQAPR